MIFFFNSRRGRLIMAFATINKAALPKATTTNTPAKVPAIEEAFTSEPSLKNRIYDAIGMEPLSENARTRENKKKKLTINYRLL